MSRKSGLDEIKNKYHTLVKIYHPDVSSDPDAEKKFMEIQKNLLLTAIIIVKKLTGAPKPGNG